MKVKNRRRSTHHTARSSSRSHVDHTVFAVMMTVKP